MVDEIPTMDVSSTPKETPPVETKETSEAPTIDTGTFHAYLTNQGMLVCFEEYADKDGVLVWDMPLVLETAVERDPASGKVSRSQGLRPLVPITKTTVIKPLSTCTMFAMEIFDETLTQAYYQTVQAIKAQLSNIVIPKSSGIVGASGAPIVGN